jgi:Cu-Zn family superoxide dismutase
MKKIFILSGILCVGLWGASDVFAAQEGISMIQGTSSDSRIHGKLTLSETADGGLHVQGRLVDVPPGEHGFHIHEFGSCEDSGTAAGGHFNPKGVEHGLLMKHGFEKAHAGDLGNISAGEDGVATIDVTVPGLTLDNGEYTVGGRAFIVHEKADDFGQPLGNAGGRIGCGPIILRGE